MFDILFSEGRHKFLLYHDFQNLRETSKKMKKQLTPIKKSYKLKECIECGDETDMQTSGMESVCRNCIQICSVCGIYEYKYDGCTCSECVKFYCDKHADKLDFCARDICAFPVWCSETCGEVKKCSGCQSTFCDFDFDNIECCVCQKNFCDDCIIDGGFHRNEEELYCIDCYKKLELSDDD